MKKIIISTTALVTLIASFAITTANNYTGHHYPPPMIMYKYNFQIVIVNNTNNVYGGDRDHFGTWFYFDFTIDGIQYTDSNFRNITIEGPWNSGGLNGSAGRMGDNDVFYTSSNKKLTIFNITFPGDAYPGISFTFGTFYWVPIIRWAHSELINFGKVIQTKDYFHNGNQYASGGVLITAYGSAGNNSATASLFTDSNT